LSFGIEPEDLTAFGRGDLGLAEEEGKVQPFLPEGGAVGRFFKGGINQGAGFLKPSRFQEFVGAPGSGVPRAGAGGKKEQRQKKKDERFCHSFTFTFTFTKKKEGTTLGRRGLRPYRD
jgi:hypothetical protein